MRKPVYIFNAGDLERHRHEVEDHTRGKSELYEASVEGNWRENKNAFSQTGVIEGWLDRLEANRDRDAVELLNGLMRKHYGKVLDYPDARGGKKGDEFRHKDRQRKFANRMLKLLEEIK